jgi:hypothetical protein
MIYKYTGIVLTKSLFYDESSVFLRTVNTIFAEIIWSNTEKTVIDMKRKKNNEPCL